jgi:hypothetical protein
MTPQQNISQAISNVAANLAAMTANPRPNYSIDGQSVSWADLYRMYTDQMMKLLEIQQALDGPFESRSVGVSR